MICNKVLREQIIKFNQHLITCAPTILCLLHVCRKYKLIFLNAIVL